MTNAINFEPLDGLNLDLLISILKNNEVNNSEISKFKNNNFWEPLLALFKPDEEPKGPTDPRRNLAIDLVSSNNLNADVNLYLKETVNNLISQVILYLKYRIYLNKNKISNDPGDITLLQRAFNGFKASINNNKKKANAYKALASYLISEGEDLDSLFHENNTVLSSLLATINKNEDNENIIDFIIEIINHKDYKPTNKLNHSLIIAVEKNNFQIFSALIEKAISSELFKNYNNLLNSIFLSEKKNSILHEAINNENMKIIDLALSNGANYLSTNRDHITPLEQAICDDKNEIIEEIIYHDKFKPADIYYAILYAVKHEKSDQAKKLFDIIKNNDRFKSLDPELLNKTHDQRKYSALHYAAHNQKEELVELLLKYGANPKISYGVRGKTPIQQACNNKIKNLLEENIKKEESLFGKFCNLFNSKVKNQTLSTANDIQISTTDEQLTK